MKAGTPGTMTVTIPAIVEHAGYPGNLITVTISDKCPVCGAQRGEIFKGLSYDGSRRLNVDCWTNRCGHVDKYSDVVKEAYYNREPIQPIELNSEVITMINTMIKQNEEVIKWATDNSGIPSTYCILVDPANTKDDVFVAAVAKKNGDVMQYIHSRIEESFVKEVIGLIKYYNIPKEHIFEEKGKQ